MVTVKRMFCGLGIIFCLCFPRAGWATVFDPMVLVVNGQISALHSSIEPENGDEMIWSSIERQNISVFSSLNSLDSTHFQTGHEEQDVLIPADKIGLLAFVLAGFLAARKQSQC